MSLDIKLLENNAAIGKKIRKALASELNKKIPAKLRTVEPKIKSCLLYTSPSPRDVEESRMPSSA